MQGILRLLDYVVVVLVSLEVWATINLLARGIYNEKIGSLLFFFLWLAPNTAAVDLPLSLIHQDLLLDPHEFLISVRDDGALLKQMACLYACCLPKKCISAYVGR